MTFYTLTICLPVEILTEMLQRKQNLACAGHLGGCLGSRMLSCLIFILETIQWSRPSTWFILKSYH